MCGPGMVRLTAKVLSGGKHLQVTLPAARGSEFGTIGLSGSTDSGDALPFGISALR
jgi:hypothetical protein